MHEERYFRPSLHVIAARARPFIDRSRHRLIYFRKRGVASFPQFSKIFFRNACNPVIFENLAIRKFLRIRYVCKYSIINS